MLMCSKCNTFYRDEYLNVDEDPPYICPKIDCHNKLTIVSNNLGYVIQTLQDKKYHVVNAIMSVIMSPYPKLRITFAAGDYTTHEHIGPLPSGFVLERHGTSANTQVRFSDEMRNAIASLSPIDKQRSLFNALNLLLMWAEGLPTNQQPQDD